MCISSKLEENGITIDTKRIEGISLKWKKAKKTQKDGKKSEVDINVKITGYVETCIYTLPIWNKKIKKVLVTQEIE